LETHVNRIGPRPTDRIAGLLPMFIRERFLFDYADDDRLCRRLNQVMRRVGLPELPPAFADVLPQARARVGPRCDELLAAPEVATMGSSRGGA
jgi:hypothetical protein